MTAHLSDNGRVDRRHADEEGAARRPGDPAAMRVELGFAVRAAAVFGATLLLAGCATQPMRTASMGGSHYDPRLGVSASERVIADGQPVPRGGGGYLTGRPYMIGGREYVPQRNPDGYSSVGTASWYGDAFHGRRTANGEIFDKESISAAHPTLPLPSYVRVTNLTNGRSMIVRVNDRGPYHGGRVMDVSQRVAETLDFRRAGTARIKVDYVGRASLAGSDDEKLMATLRTNGTMAQLDGSSEGGGFGALASLVAPAAPEAPTPPSPPQQSRVAELPTRPQRRAEQPPVDSLSEPAGRPANVPLPPIRPFDVSQEADPQPQRGRRQADWRDRVGDVDRRRS